MNENSKQRISKKIFSILTLLLLGALGSGLWDIFLKDLLYYLGRNFVDFISIFYKGYVDSLYENVGKGTLITEFFPTLAILIFIIALPGFVIIIFKGLVSTPKKNEEKDDIDKSKGVSKLRKKTIFLIASFCIISIFYISMLIKETSNFKAVHYVDRNIEIVRPVITNLDYLKLRSEFRRIDNRQKLNNIIDTLFYIGKNNSLELPQCNLYGIKIGK